jgi:hypothetical protein
VRSIIPILVTLTCALLFGCQRADSSPSCEKALEHLAALSTARLPEANRATAARHADNIARGASSAFLSSCRARSEASRNDYTSCVLDADDMSSARGCQQ